MSKSGKYVLIVSILLLFTMLSVPFWFNRDLWYARVYHARVYYQNRHLAESQVYRSHDGKRLLILMNHESYIVSLKPLRVFDANRNVFILMPRWAYSKEVYRGIPLDGTQAKLDNFHADPVINTRSVEFSSYGGGRIRVKW